jgi:hypothetical protein
LDGLNGDLATLFCFETGALLLLGAVGTWLKLCLLVFVPSATWTPLWPVCLTWCEPCFLIHPCQMNEPAMICWKQCPYSTQSKSSSEYNVDNVIFISSDDDHIDNVIFISSDDDDIDETKESTNVNHAEKYGSYN